MEYMKWIILGIAVVMYSLIFILQDKKLWFTTGAALIVILIGIIFPNSVFPLPEDVIAKVNPFPAHIFALQHSFVDLINWNIILLFAGSMAIVSTLIYAKLPEAAVCKILRGSKNGGWAITILLIFTGVLSIFLENVLTVVVMCPVGIALCKKLNVKPLFIVIGIAMVANLEGCAALIASPLSLVFAGLSDFTFTDFFVQRGRVSIFFATQIAFLIGIIIFYFVFARKDTNKIEFEEVNVVSHFPAFIFILMIAGLIAISFVHTSVNYMSGVYVFALGLVCLFWLKVFQKKSDREITDFIKDLDWKTVFFIMGLYVITGALKATGLLEEFGNLLASKLAGAKIGAFAVLMIVSILLCGFVDNIPYIMLMFPIAHSMAEGMNVNPELFTFAIFTGACLGGNLTPFGAGANIVAVGMLKKENIDVKLKDWVKLGIPLTLVTAFFASIIICLCWI